MLSYYVFILCNKRHQEIQVGVTSDLRAGVDNQRRLINRRHGKRIWQKLVYVESLRSVEEAVEREWMISRMSDKELVRLIELVNPSWEAMSVSSLLAAGFSRSSDIHQK